MAYDETIAARVRAALADQEGLEEKRMFGGVAFLLHGHMCCGVQEDRLILRLGETQGNAAFGPPYVKPFAPTGRAMKGWVTVEGEGIAADAALANWLQQAAAFTRALPPK